MYEFQIVTEYFDKDNVNVKQLSETFVLEKDNDVLNRALQILRENKDTLLVAIVRHYTVKTISKQVKEEKKSSESNNG